MIRSLFAIALYLVLSSNTGGQELLVAPQNGLGIYQLGQTVGWSIQVKGANSSKISEAAFSLKQGGMVELAKGQANLSEGKGHIEAKLDEPGWLLLEVTVKPEGGRPIKTLGGALVAPERIQPAQPRPDDFDLFWQAKLADLAAIPMNPELDPVGSGNTNLDYYRIALDNIRGSRIRGQLARPRTGDKFPAMLIVQAAGVYPLQKGWVTGHAAAGWLVLNINAHDLPIDNPEPFYQEQSAGALKDYPSIGNDDRETSYFLRMYLSCFRAAQYLAERPDWDGRTLIVTGVSQGGLQSIVTAALHPKVTAVLADVPAGCDLNGPLAKRLPGWPRWYGATKGKDVTKVRLAARYYDVVNFASRVKCPVLVGVGLIDTTCPSPGVFAACNQFAGPKEVVVLPFGKHVEKNGSHDPYYARFKVWEQTLLKGNSAPVR